jgi:hypothetical protein
MLPARHWSPLPWVGFLLLLFACGGSPTQDNGSTPPVLTTVSVSLGASSIQVGQSTQATAAGLDQHGATISTGAVTWASTSPSVASVSEEGAITAISAGQTGITASAGGKTGTATLTVVAAPPVVTSINVSLLTPSLEANTTTTATAAVLDQNGAVMPGQTVTWSSENTALATVGGGGVVTGVAPGATSIVASAGGKQGKAPLTITGWIFDGPVLSNADFGGAPGALADVSVLRLADGRYRMIIGGFPNSPGGFGSAISSDGIRFSLENGVRLATPVQIGGVGISFVKPVAMRMDDGRIRLFASANVDATGGIYSFTSSDEGVTFTPDAGIRLTLAATGLAQVGTGSIVKVRTGGWRIYLNDNPPAGGLPKTLSAFSPDLTSWTMDPGVRIGAGAPLSGAAQSAGSVLNADGSTTLIYFRNNTANTYQSTAADGLTFITETRSGFGTNERVPIPAIDTYLLPLATGDVRVYFNYGDMTAGTIYTAHHAPFLNR